MDNLDSNISRELIIEIDSKGNITKTTNNCYNILGYNPGEMLYLNIYDLISDHNIDLLEAGKNKLKLIFHLKNKGQKYLDVLIHPVINNKDEVVGAKLSIIDVSRITKAKKQDFLTILELSRDIIYMVELVPELKMVYLNSAITRKLGTSLEENYNNPNLAFESVHPEDKANFIMKINDKLDYTTPIQVRYKHVNGEYIWFEESVIPIYNSTRKLIGLVGFCRDIQEQKVMEERLRKLSYYDSLTGIRNRTYFEKEINDLNFKTNKAIGIIICDLDNLKYLNDNLGHLRGDELLKDFANILDKYTNNNTTAARIGGDEFVILLKDKSHKDLKEIYMDLIKSIERYNLKNKLPIRVSIGTGYSEFSIGSTEWVFNTADSKMYEAKVANKKYYNDIKAIVEKNK